MCMKILKKKKTYVFRKIYLGHFQCNFLRCDALVREVASGARPFEFTLRSLTFKLRSLEAMQAPITETEWSKVIPIFIDLLRFDLFPEVSRAKLLSVCSVTILKLVD